MVGYYIITSALIVMAYLLNSKRSQLDIVADNSAVLQAKAI